MMAEKDDGQKAAADGSLRCDVLLLFATSSEQDALQKAAVDMGLQFSRRTIEDPVGEKVSYFSLGHVGANRVNGMRTEMGPLSYGGSASRAIYFQTEMDATAIIQLGMAFGIDPRSQNVGDVLVSTSVIPYDRREVKSVCSVDAAQSRRAVDHDESRASDASWTDEKAGGDQGGWYTVDYSRAEPHPAKDVLIRMFEREFGTGEYEHDVFFGGILSGGAQVSSRSFVRELYDGVPQAEDGIVGGEMEGVGLLSVSPPDDPLWVVVKGISDFADKDRHRMIETSRPIACENSARFVLSALRNTELFRD